MTRFTHGHTPPLLVRASQAETLGVAPTTIQLLADGDLQGGISVARSRLAKGTDGPPPHYHATSPEIFFIIDGGLHVLCGQQVLTLGAGDYLLVPPNTPHAFATPHDTAVDLLFIMPGVERFAYFRLGDRIARGHASPKELLATQERFDNHFLKSEIWDAHRHAEGGDS
jgi:quercetin dioxygenase-like cupin family protein